MKQPGFDFEEEPNETDPHGCGESHLESLQTEASNPLRDGLRRNESNDRPEQSDVSQLQGEAREQYISLLVEQTRRDTEVLNGDPHYHVPSREFYEWRVGIFREEVKRLRNR